MLSSKAELCGSIELTQRLAEMDGRVCGRRPHPLQSFVALVSGQGGAQKGRGRGLTHGQLIVGAVDWTLRICDRYIVALEHQSTLCNPNRFKL